MPRDDLAGRLGRRRTRTVLLATALATVAALLVPSGVEAHRTPRLPAVQYLDVAYAPADPAGGRGHLLDIYLPARRADARLPVLVWSSGSGWLSDNGKQGAAAFAGHFNDAGYAVIGLSVRSSLQATFPAQLHDAKAAIRWLRRNAARYQLDPARIAVSGNSSGGWVATMLGVTGSVRALEGEVGVTGESSRVQAVVNFFGPTDLLAMDAQMLPGACERFNAAFGLVDCHNDPNSPEGRLVGCAIQTCPARSAAADPVNYVSRDDPPMLILHGQADELVPHGQSVVLFDTLEERCLDATFHSIPGVGHSTSFVFDTSQATEQTVFQTARCRTKSWQGFRRHSEPDLDYWEAFLDHTLRRGGP
jgi:acetyl esterase/lipase